MRSSVGALTAHFQHFTSDVTKVQRYRRADLAHIRTIRSNACICSRNSAAHTRSAHTCCFIKMAGCRNCINYWRLWKGLGSGTTTRLWHLSRTVSVLRWWFSLVILPVFFLLHRPLPSPQVHSSCRPLRSTKEPPTLVSAPPAQALLLHLPQLLAAGSGIFSISSWLFVNNSCSRLNPGFIVSLLYPYSCFLLFLMCPHICLSGFIWLLILLGAFFRSFNHVFP